MASETQTKVRRVSTHAPASQSKAYTIAQRNLAKV